MQSESHKKKYNFTTNQVKYLYKYYYRKNDNLPLYLSIKLDCVYRALPNQNRKDNLGLKTLVSELSIPLLKEYIIIATTSKRYFKTSKH